MARTAIFEFTDGAISASALSRDIDTDDVVYQLSTDGGATTSQFTALNDWVSAVATTYGANFISLGKINEKTLNSEQGDLFAPRLNGDSVRLSGKNVAGSYRFRFDNAEDASRFFQFFDRIDEFVEDNDIFNESPICFCADTRIATPRGERAICDLSVGDRVSTADGDTAPVRWIWLRSLGTRALQENPRLRPVAIAPGALGDGRPFQRLRVSRQHRMIVRSPIAARMFGLQEVLVPAFRLVGLPGITVEAPVRPITYAHLLLDRHRILWANGAPSESLHTGAEALRALRPAAAAELCALFPDLAAGAAPRALARTVPAGPAQRRLIDRHRKNARALLS